MCDIDLEPCSVWKVSRPTARKAHTCKSCGRRIEPGTQYVRLNTVFDGSASSEASCAECWADHEEFGGADGHCMTNPAGFPELLRECVYTRWVEDPSAPNGERAEHSGEWAPMLVRLEERMRETA